MSRRAAHRSYLDTAMGSSKPAPGPEIRGWGIWDTNCGQFTTQGHQGVGEHNNVLERMVEEQSRAVAGAAAAPGDERRFVCTHAGCSKRFTRAEHLQRHALNHTPGAATCPRCSAHFKRPDLLGRPAVRPCFPPVWLAGVACKLSPSRFRRPSRTRSA
jgi:hypothetical protein